MKTILWDNDGILVETEHLYYETSKKALNEVGYVLSMEEFKDVSLRQGGSVLELASKKGVDQAGIDKIRKKRHRYYIDLIREEVEPRKGIEDCLKALHGKVNMGIVTSSLREHFDEIHEKTGLLKYIKFFLTREDYKEGKPKPEPYLTALTEQKLKSEDCVVVEDSERGVQAAKAAGLLCFAVPNAMSKEGNFESADAVFTSIPELTEGLKMWAGI